MKKSNKAMHSKNYTYLILIAVLFLLIIFTAFMLVQTKDYVGQAFRQYQKETKFSPEDTSRFTAEYKEQTYQKTKEKQLPKRLAASKPGSGNNQIAWYSEEDYAQCKINQDCIDKFDAGKDETKQGTILYYDPKKQECYTATDGCKDNKFLIEYHCENYLASKSKSLNVFDSITCKYGCNAKQGRCNAETEQQYGNCNDGVKNQNEQNVDCGGICPLKCANCNDFKLNQNELFVDCGGICPACDNQKTQHCANKIKDADETGVDCGGLTCGPCKNEIKTLYPNQCKNEFKDSNEEKIDCGGPCPPCKYTEEINKQPDAPIPDHCKNNLFDATVEEKIDCGKECPACTQPSCVDNLQNQGETGIDCGGPCPLCSEKQDCSYDSDKDAAGDDNQKKGINFAVPGYVIYQGKKISDSCNGNLLKEKYCTIDGEATEFQFCSDGCIETEDGAVCDKKTCADSDAYAPVMTVEILGIEVYSYDTKYSIPGSAEQKDTKGAVTAGPLADECIDTDAVNEAYCSGNTPAYKQFNCPKEAYGYDLFDGCANGACCANKVKCIDGDIEENGGNNAKAGKNIFKKSITQSPKICLSSNPSVYKPDTCGVTYCLADATDSAVIDNTNNGYNCNNNLGKKIENQESNYGDLVQEYYCDGTAVKSQWFSCPQGQACLQGECKELTCIDTDINAPKPDYITGSVTGIGFENSLPILKTFNDVCIQGDLLKEYKCGTRNLDYSNKNAELISGELYAVYDLVYCPGKCKSGKCIIDFNPVAADPFAKCTDSDADNYYNKGYIEIIHQGNPLKKDIMKDVCLTSDNTIVTEWTCKDNGTPIYKKCEQGCWDGKCL
ncbi:hypothetical protein HZA96_01255 [Candidatus Woesearchaeota archaeon]|nr:hypothetical protein [Candidatus Woesearchaeota archaeon]